MSAVAESQLTIVNEKGLHVRAATVFAQAASRFQSAVTVAYGGERANGKSVMNLLLLTAAKGAIVTVTVEGADATDALAALEEVVAVGFYEGDSDS